MIPVDGCVISWALYRKLVSDTCPGMMEKNLRKSFKKWLETEWLMYQCSVAGDLFVDAAEEINRVGSGRNIILEEWRHLALFAEANLSKELYNELITELTRLNQPMF